MAREFFDPQTQTPLGYVRSYVGDQEVLVEFDPDHQLGEVVISNVIDVARSWQRGRATYLSLIERGNISRADWDKLYDVVEEEAIEVHGFRPRQ